MLKIDFTSTVRKSVILTLFGLFLMSCICLLMIGSSFHVAEPPKSYLGLDNIAETSQQRVRFLNTLGYDVSPDSEESESIRIPIEFGDVYNNYNELQKRKGTDLLDYRGAECVRYTYCESGSDLRCNLIVYQNRIIGGDVCTAALDGEMRNL